MWTHIHNINECLRRLTYSDVWVYIVGLFRRASLVQLSSDSLFAIVVRCNYLKCPNALYKRLNELHKPSTPSQTACFPIEGGALHCYLAWMWKSWLFQRFGIKCMLCWNTAFHSAQWGRLHRYLFENGVVIVMFGARWMKRLLCYIRAWTLLDFQSQYVGQIYFLFTFYDAHACSCVEECLV